VVASPGTGRMRVRSLECTRWPMLTLSSLVLGCLFVGMPAPSWAVQSEIELDVASSCAECALGIDTVFLLDGQAEDVGPLEAVWTMAVDSRGRYWVTYGPEHLPQVFSDEGVLVANIGSRGHGPGEFLTPLAVVPVGDSMAVFDTQNRRMTMVGPDLRAHRTMRIEGEVLRGAPLPWPRVVVNARIPTPDAAGFPFHILNLQTGAVERSFGGRPEGDFTPHDRMRLSGVLASDLVRGEIWTAQQGVFRIDRRSLEGDLVETLKAAPSWFAGDLPPSMGSPQSPPHPRIATLHRSDEGLWIGFLLPADTWRRAWPRGASGGPHSPGAPSPDRTLLYEARLTLLDPETRQFLGWRSPGLSSIGTGWIPGGFQSYDPAGSGGVFPTRTVYSVYLDRR
jgi:hypothetical protein